MDPITLVLAAVVAGSSTMMALGPHLKRRIFKGDTDTLRAHGLVVHSGVYQDAVPVAPALTARVSHSSDATRGLMVFVTAPSTWTGLRTRTFWARRHENLGDEFIGDLPLVNSEGPARGDPCRWRKVAAGGFVGAVPAACCDSFADDVDARAALAGLLSTQAAEIETLDDGVLLFRFERPASVGVEAEVRRCLDLTRAALAALDRVAARLPDLDDGDLPDLVPESSARPSSGSPLLVRGIR